MHVPLLIKVQYSNYNVMISFWDLVLLPPFMWNCMPYRLYQPTLHYDCIMFTADHFQHNPRPPPKLVSATPI